MTAVDDALRSARLAAELDGGQRSRAGRADAAAHPGR